MIPPLEFPPQTSGERHPTEIARAIGRGGERLRPPEIHGGKWLAIGREPVKELFLLLFHYSTIRAN